jgi:flagellar motor switch protein FliN
VAIKKPAGGEDVAVMEPLNAEVDTAQTQAPRAALSMSKIDSVLVTLSVELGREEFQIRDLKALRQNQVVALDRGVGDPVDVRINGKLVARGEVVATEGNKYGVRITETVPSDSAEAKSAGTASS